MEKQQLVLEYLKLLVWPLLVIIVVLTFRDPIFNVLGSGNIEIELFGVKLKGSKANIEQVKGLEDKAAQLQKKSKHVVKRYRNSSGRK